MSPVLCLNMIVKDEASIIRRLVDSVAAHIGYYVVCDTGSSDDTPNLIRSLFSERGVEGEIHSIPFVDFQQARNKALELARHSSQKFDYLMLVDADMELVVEDSTFAKSLCAESYLVKQQAGSLAYFNVRLLRRDAIAEYVGRTHEYLDVAEKRQLNGIKFNDHACGSSREMKLERDKRLLLDALKDDPEDVRSMFYLAQTCKESGDFSEAIAWYRMRSQAGGYAEEAWYAQYQLALCFKYLGDEERFVQECNKAFEQNPNRAEPLYEVARHYRETGRPHLAFSYAEAAQKVKCPSDSWLFVDEEVYRSGISEEIAICGFYSSSLPDQEKGRASCYSLAVSPTAPMDRVELARRNSFHYAQPAHEVFPSARATEIKIDTPQNWSTFNPSIAEKDNQLFCLVRSSNYQLINGYSTVVDGSDAFCTQSYFVELDLQFDAQQNASLHINSSHLVGTGNEQRPKFLTPVRGYEDCRLFWANHSWMCSASLRDADPRCDSRIALLWLNRRDVKLTDVQMHQQAVSKAIVFDSPQRRIYEKNWIPLIRNDELFFIQDHGPFFIYKFDESSSSLKPVNCPQPLLRLDHFRGNSQAIAFDNGWLYVIHEVVHFAENERAYLHRFVFLDDTFKIRSITDPFYFLEKGIEFCAGLAMHSASGMLIASFGKDECQAHLMCFDPDEVRAMLRAVEDYCEEAHRGGPESIISLPFSAYGVPFAISASSQSRLSEMFERLPPKSFCLPHAIFQPPVAEFCTSDLGHLGQSDPRVSLDLFESELGVYIAEHSKEFVFIHAGVVCVDGKAILIPGRSFSGKTTLVEAFLKAGATYYSDEFALIDEAGMVHPYPRPLSMRVDSNGSETREWRRRVNADSLGTTTGAQPVSVSHVLVTTYERDTEECELQVLTPGQMVLAILDNAVGARRDPEKTMKMAAMIANGAKGLSLKRGEAQKFVSQFLEEQFSVTAV